ncbi:FliM/FliN family flagellar motor switch protein [Trinickia diaoshuihuensis]|uniref:FliM/FliN family flagellar motor switch protein n=1 Tax=Trinickia diaoshuihuensis TaxID=2292265 RepID=UPI0013C34B19|nr:FliM/FliN family flagellar motor switch protein [Trinickia diaoshuihuensis]
MPPLCGELLPAERARRDARPVRALRDAAQVALAAAADALLARWCRDWGLAEQAPSDEPTVCRHSWEASALAPIGDAVWHRVTVDEAAGSIWWSWQAQESRQAIAAVPADSLDAVQAVLFGGRGAAGGLANDAAAAAWADWCDRLARQCGATCSTNAGGAGPDEAQALPELFSQRWTGAVLLRRAIRDRILWLALDVAAAEGWLHTEGFDAAAGVSGTASPLTPFAAALRDVPVNVHVELRPVDVALGDLMGLALGDVICTRHAIDAPLQICLTAIDGGASASLCHAHLGMRDGARAVVLVKHTA